MQGEKTVMVDDVMKDFVLIIQEDNTVQQGMYPDGLIKGTWTFDEKTMMFTVKDDVTASSYPMKIISLTSSALVLQDSISSLPLTIYYKWK